MAALGLQGTGLFDVALGVVLCAAIAYAGLRSPRVSRAPVARRIGWALIAVPLPLAVSLRLAAGLPGVLDQTIFVVAIGCFAVGALVVLGEQDDGGDWSEADPDSPPWWPDFERDLREYTARRVRV